jgi:hypothetical protein
VLETNTGQKDYQAYFSGHDPVSEIDGLFVLVDRKFTHRGTNGWDSAKALDEPGKFIASTAL